MEIIKALITIFLVAVFTNNIILSTGYGICSYIGVSKKKNSALGMGIALLIVVMISSIVCYFLNKILVLLNIEFMQTICFILIIASLVQITEMIIKKYSSTLYKSLGIYLPLITTNCIVLYVSKQVCNIEILVEGLGLSNNIINNLAIDFVFSLVYAFGIAVGYIFVIYILSTIREKIDYEPVLKNFKGPGIALITTSIMALAINGLLGIF